MPPKARSLTARSRAANQSNLPTFEEDLRNLDLGTGPARSFSPDNDAAERRETEDIEIGSTPRSRKITPTVDSQRRDGARIADPNEGRCLITNRPTVIQLSHVIAKATNSITLSKLEYVWEIRPRQLHLDTRHNLLHLRADWHILFDKSEWTLVPEFKIIEELKKIYLTDERLTSNLAEHFKDKEYRYYVVPAPSLQEVICRFPNVNSHEHESHVPPFSTLGPLTSHIYPHYVIFNTGQKLERKFGLTDINRMSSFLAQNPSITVADARSALDVIAHLYIKWMETTVPTNSHRHEAPPNPPHSLDEGQDDPSQGGPPPRREGLRSATRSQGQGSQTPASRYDGGQQRAIHPFQSPRNDDSSSVTDDTVVEDNTAWIEYIQNWQKQGKGTMELWESGVLNDSGDEQLAAYINEHARTPPSPGVWSNWQPAWNDSKSRYPSMSERSRYSSNDWAIFKTDVYLTGTEHSQVTL